LLTLVCQLLRLPSWLVERYFSSIGSRPEFCCSLHPSHRAALTLLLRGFPCACISAFFGICKFALQHSVAGTSYCPVQYHVDFVKEQTKHILFICRSKAANALWLLHNTESGMHTAGYRLHINGCEASSSASLRGHEARLFLQQGELKQRVQNESVKQNESGVTWGRALSTQAPENFIELRRISRHQLCGHKPLVLAVLLESALRGS
jgi:hypothetical protein